MNLLAVALSDFFIFFGVDDKRRMALYYESLCDENIDFVIEKLRKLRKSWEPAYGEKIPSVKEILEEKIDPAEFERDFKILIRTASKLHYREQVEPWAHEAVMRIGYDRMLNLQQRDEEKIRKEFQEIYADVKIETPKLAEHQQLKHSEPTEDGRRLIQNIKEVLGHG